MNTNEVLALCSLIVLFIVRLRFFEIKYFYYTLVTVFTIGLLRIFAILSYDKWLDRKIINDQLDKILDETIIDVDDVTTLTSTDINKIEFPEDEKRKQENKRLIEKSSIVFAVLLSISLVCLYVIDVSFYRDMYKILFGVIILLAAEFYFSYSVSSNIENDTIKGVRQQIIDKIIKE